MIVVFAQKYDKNAGVGTIAGGMLLKMSLAKEEVKRKVRPEAGVLGY
jgi:hypothetical protein